jgi:hypothetical protein
MFFAITNIYNNKTNGPTLMKFFTATGKLETFFWQIEMFDVCTTGDTAHIEHSSCKKKNFFRFSVTVNNSIKVGPSVFLL